ncbi:MAG: aspartate/glutamate racemase family protein [Planctomycetota bacterium]
MKVIGLIGGMSWESTVEYYRIVNQYVARRLGGLHSACCVMYSFDFQEIEELQHRADWDGAARRMIDAARSVERAGADFIVICTNTMHKLAEAVQDAVPLPLLHIADPTAASVLGAGVRKVGLLATRFTMEENFYRQRLVTRHGLEVIIPTATDRQVVHDVIYQELCRGEIKPDSRQRFQTIIQQMADAGCAGVILGCTEIGLLIKPPDSPLPLFDTTEIHAEAAAEFALSDEPGN